MYIKSGHTDNLSPMFKEGERPFKATNVAGKGRDERVRCTCMGEKPPG